MTVQSKPTQNENDKKKNADERPMMPPPMMPGQLMMEHNLFYFTDEFTRASTKYPIQFIIEKNLLPASQRPKDITLIINSPGGDMAAAFALIDTMKGSAVPVKTIGLGLIASCGLLTFMSGVKGHRVLTPNTSILSHQYSWGSYGKEHELFAVVREFDLTTQRMLEHYKACTGLPEKKIREILLPPEDVWLSAEDAVKYKIADKVKKLY